MNRIVWLASYPKSGNTWFRIFLTNFLRDGVAPVEINRLDDGPMASERAAFDAAVGYDSSEMRADEIERLRPEVYLHQARAAKETIFCKVHDAYTRLPDGRPLIPPAGTQGALYVVRNPLDVCVSFAHHAGHEEFDRIIRRMADPTHALFADNQRELNQLPQKLLTWSGHVLSWTEASEIPVHIVRYEDMKSTPEETFTSAVRFLGLPDHPARVRKAIAFSCFEELRRQEETGGFAEKLPQAPVFFRKGTVGSWRDVLTRDHARQLVRDHATVMRKFGYLDASDAPVF